MSAPELGVAATLRRGLPDVPLGGRLALQRARLLDAVRRQAEPPPATRRWRLGFGLCGVATLALASAGVLIVPSATTNATPVRATLAGQPLREDGFIETLETARTLTFSEGSRVQLARHSKARMRSLGPEAAHLILEAGSVHAKITKGTGLTWTIAAGPYRVRVIGTEFDVGWDFKTQRFRVHVIEGQVRVSGADLPRAGVTLLPGQSLHEQPSLEDPATLESRAATPEHGTPQPKDESRSTPRGTPPPPPATPSWQQLARNGHYDRALRAARRAGLPSQLSGADADDLLLLANTARYAGDTDTARTAFIRLRERYPGHPTASLAAFSLGKLAIDAEGNPTEAVRWFRTFLQASPEGDLAAGARARLMNALLAVGDRRAAEAVARDYLKFHPEGPQRDTARALLGSLPPQ